MINRARRSQRAVLLDILSWAVTIIFMLLEVRCMPFGVKQDIIAAMAGQSIFHDPVSKRDVMAYHYVKKDAPEGSYLGLNYLDFSSDWPKVV